MKLSYKIALVAGGYVVAFLIASAIVALRVATTSGPASQASSGMHAFGDALLFVAAFGVIALVPTGAVLYFLKGYHRFWKVLSLLGLAVAVTGVVAAVLFAVGRHLSPPSPLAIWSGWAVLRILVAPLLALAFIVCAFMSPAHPSRLMLLTATALEAAVAAYGGFIWFVPLFFHSR
jgi:hypothetical protein